MSINRRTFTESLAALGVTAATPALAQGATVEVSMKQSPKMVFVPASVNVKVGDAVKWTTPYNITPTVTFAAGRRCAIRFGRHRGRRHVQPHLHGEGHLQICLQVP